MRSSRERREKGREEIQVPPVIRNVMRIPSSYFVSTLGRPPRPFQLESATWNRVQSS